MLKINFGKINKKIAGFLVIFLLCIFYNVNQFFEIYTYGQFLHVLILSYVAFILYFFVFSLYHRHNLRFLSLTLIFLLFLFNSIAIYAINTFNVAINYDLYIDVLFHKTDQLTEYAKSLIHVSFLFYVIIGTILPFLIVIYLFRKKYIEFRYSKNFLLYIGLISILLALVSYHFYHSRYYFAEKTEIRLLTWRYTPNNYMLATIRFIQRAKRVPPKDKIKICEDATIQCNSEINDNFPRTVIFILGESARNDHFSINGYHKNTNPELTKEQGNLVVFRDFESCNTSTWRSVPCIFSRLNSDEFTLPPKHENLLDILHRVGISTYWLSSQGECIAVCDYMDNKKLTIKSDEELVGELEIILKNDNKNSKFIVLHHNGSHYPYHSNYNKKHELFVPACKENDFTHLCNLDEIINAYDNTIVATDEFISNVIKVAKKYDYKHNIIVMYTSDHGESLGENDVFMHALPKIIAPKTQLDVPFFIWITERTAKNFDINRKTLMYNAKYGHFHHDQIFDSILKLFNIESTCCSKNDDIFTTNRLSKNISYTTIK